MKKYDVIYADPAWRYNNQSPPCLPEKQPDTCKIEYYYPTMTIKEIQNLPVKELANKDCVLFMWATTPAINEALETVKAWGFKYKTMITWEKTNRDCMGYWFRVCTEHLIVAVRGKVKAFRDMERTCYHEKRGKHSKKPEHFYETIERVTNGDRLELFARQKREGWDVWGNEVESDINLMAAIADKEGGEEKTIKTGKQHEPNNEAQAKPCNIYGVSVPKGTVCPRCKNTGMYYEPESSYPRTPCDECGQTAC